MTLPIDRTAKAALDLNLVNGILSDAPKIKANNDVVYNTIDELNAKVNTNYASGAVGTTQLADGSVTTAKLADGSVTTAKIADSAVTLAKMADSSVGTTELVDGSVTRPKIANNSVGSSQLDATLLTDFGDIAVQAEFDRRAINVMKYGAVGDGVTDDTAALQAVFNLGGNVFIPVGTYKHTGLVISNSVNIRSPIGNIAILNNTSTNDSFIINVGCTIDGLMISGSGVSGSGILLNTSCKVSNCIITAHGGYGVKFSDTANVISQHFNKCTISHNILGGVYSKSVASYQKNLVVFNQCYVVGSGGANVNATPTTGHGFYIDGGVAWTISGTVSETSTGAGIYVKATAAYGIYGLTVVGCHLEQNQYANIYVDAALGVFKDINISGNYYFLVTDFPNSITASGGPRTIVASPLRLTNSSIDGTYDYNSSFVAFNSQKQTLKLGGEFETLLPYPFTSHLVAGDTSTGGYNALKLNSALGAGYTEPVGYSTYIDPRWDYRFMYEYKYTKSISTSAQLIILQLDINKVSLATPIPLTLTSGGAWIIQDRLLKSTSFLTTTRYLQINLIINGTLDATDALIVRKILINQSNAALAQSGTTAERPAYLTLPTGFHYYDTTLSKPIWWNGSAWKDATGTTV